MTDLLLDALAVYRLTHLLTDDAIFDKQRAQVQDALRAAGHTKVAYFVTCSWCSGLWFAAGVVLARRLFPRVWSPCARVLAFSAATGILSER